MTLQTGRVPLRLDWFNCARDFAALEVSCQQSNALPRRIAHEDLWQSSSDQTSGATNLLHGVRAECYTGNWESVPDFDLLRPIKTGITTNFDLDFKTRDEKVGIRFAGYFNAPYTGNYRFQLSSDEGSLLFFGPVEVPIRKLGRAAVPKARASLMGEAVNSFDERPWVTIEGRVSFISKMGKGLELELRSERDSVWVRLADGTGVDPLKLLHAHLRIVGIGHGVLTTDRGMVLGRVLAASAKELSFVENADVKEELPSVLTTARQVPEPSN